MPSYGPPIPAALARTAANAALAEAAAHHWAMAVAVVDPAGVLVYFEKADDTQHGSVTVAIDKARSAALFKRPTKAFEDVLAAGGAGVRILAIGAAIPIEGGVPITIDGLIVGAIGVSGGTSEQDGQCARAGASTV